MPQEHDGVLYHDDGTYVQDIDGYIYEVTENASSLRSLRNGNLLFRTRIAASPWTCVTGSAHTVVIPCDCPRHQGTLTFHPVSNT